MSVDDIYPFRLKGRTGVRKIKIPVRREEVGLETVKKFLPKVLSEHEKNASKIQYFEDFTDGSRQPIDDKDKPYKTSSQANNKIKENHAANIVEFKTGFALGDKKQFTQKINADSDDITYLNKFLDDVSFYKQDLQLRYNVYATGIGTDFTQPRTDILVRENNNVRYKSEQEGYDPASNSPFVYQCVDSKTNAVVYSSYIGEYGMGDLFCFNISETPDGNNNLKKIVTVWTRDETYIFDDMGDLDKVQVIPSNGFHELPMTEHRLNDGGIGTIETVEDLLNAVNTLVSSSVDNVEDVVNQLLVFSGCDLDDGDVESFYQKGAILLPKGDGVVTPDVKTISVDLRHSEVNVLFEEILTRLYDIAAVPLASAAVSSGNNEAAYLGGGWTNAYNAIKRDILYFEEADREVLKKWLAVCRLNPQNPVDNLNANEIEIKYNVNQSNNLVNKTQALQNLVDANLPLEDILKAVGLWGDIHTVAERWQNNIDKLKAEQKETDAEASVKPQQTIGAEANLNNPSVQ